MIKPHYPHPLIAREGWPFLAASVALALVASFWSPGWSVPLWVIALFVLQFFRDPPRTGSSELRAVLAPADGRIVVVQEAWDPYAQRNALKISVFNAKNEFSSMLFRKCPIIYACTNEPGMTHSCRRWAHTCPYHLYSVAHFAFNSHLNISQLPLFLLIFMTPRLDSSSAYGT